MQTLYVPGVWRHTITRDVAWEVEDDVHYVEHLGDLLIIMPGDGDNVQLLLQHLHLVLLLPARHVLWNVQRLVESNLGHLLDSNLMRNPSLQR